MADKLVLNRYKKRLTIYYGINEATQIAFSEDFSTTGMFIKTAKLFPPNSKIKIAFNVENQLVEIEAQVIWGRQVPQRLLHLVKKAGMGVRFLRFISGKEHFFNLLGQQVQYLPPSNKP